MTGPEHYREAERLQDEADTWILADRELMALLTAAALVHATLAQAAHTAYTGEPGSFGGLPST